MQLNGVSGTSYSSRVLRNQNGTAGSYSQSSVASANDMKTPDASLTANTFSNDEIYIPNYAGSTFKSWSIDNCKELNATNSDGMNQLIAELFSNTGAITSIEIGATQSANLAQYSTATLYGIKSS